MAKKGASKPAMKFVVDYLTKKKTAEYSEVQAAAAARGYKIWPILYGRAQTMLGINKGKKRGAAKKPGRPAGSGRRAGTRTAPATRGRRAAVATGAGMSGVIDGLNSAVEELRRYRKALDAISQAVAEAIG